jgi:hypothetical protein
MFIPTQNAHLHAAFICKITIYWSNYKQFVQCCVKESPQHHDIKCFYLHKILYKRKIFRKFQQHRFIQICHPYLDSWSEGRGFDSRHCHVCLQPWASCFTSIVLVLRMRRKTEVPCSTWCLRQWQAKDPIQVRNMSSLWWTPPPWSKTESQPIVT